MRMPAFNGKEQKNRDFLLILWKPVLGIDDYTDFTSLMGYFLLAVWNMTIYLIVIFFFFNFHLKCSNLLFKDEMDGFFFLMVLKMVISSFE